MKSNSRWNFRTAPPQAMKFGLKQLTLLADWETVAISVVLPWSTSATSILIVIWLVTVMPTLNLPIIWRELKTPAGGLPVALWLLAVFGLLWADVSWPERFGGLGSFHRLLMIPLLLAQFRRSANGWWVFYGFLASTTALMLASWGLATGLSSWQTNHVFGVVVHDAIAQSTIFLICSFALVWAMRIFLFKQNWWMVTGLSLWAALFILNLAFVATSRAEVMVAPILIILLGWRWQKWRGAILACVAVGSLALAAWLSSPYLRARVQQAVDDVQIYRATGAHNDVGDHVEFIRKSLTFVREAPIIGYGTGSIPELFRRSTAGQNGAAAIQSVNPHNQILAVAIQLGLLGVAALVAMWLAHYFLFCGISSISWVGTIVVVDNVVSSLSSSHLFDFVHGWLYVFGVGISGGMMLGNAQGHSR